MVVIEARIHVEGDQATSEPATEAQEDEARDVGEGSGLRFTDGYTLVSTVSAVNLIGILVESRDSHLTTTHVGLNGLLESTRLLLDNDNLRLSHGLVHRLTHRLLHHGYLFLLSHGLLHHGLLFLLHHRLAVITLGRGTDLVVGGLHIFVHSRVVCHIL